MTENNKPYRVGLVLSGGGARGFAHIGILKALNEHGIYPDIISAVSAGSIVGSMYADGYKPDDIFDHFSEWDIYSILKFYRPGFGVLKAIGIRKTLNKYLSTNELAELKIPLIISATNFAKATTEYFTEGSIVDAVMASSAVPLVLKPYIINGNMYVDGGLMNNLPVDPLIDKCDFIIGVNVNPVNETTQINSFRNYADRVLHLAIRANVHSHIPKFNLYIEPEKLAHYGLFKLSAAKEIYETGYSYASQLLDQWQRNNHL
jgi:NTE family protein